MTDRDATMFIRGMAFGAIIFLVVVWFCSCTSPRYDYNGNGTSFCDRAAMSLGRVINKQRPPSRWEHSPEEYR